MAIEILEEKLLTKNGKVVAIRAHDGQSPAGYYAILVDDADDYYLYDMPPIERALARIATMRWQRYTHYTTVYLDPADIAFYSEARDDQIKLYWCEILNYNAFECRLSDEQVKDGITRPIPQYCLY